jgi:hypothetical protein
MREVKLLVSVDTEEDNWTPTRNDIEVENARALPGLQAFLEGLGVRPTYFVNYPLATTPWAAPILRGLRASGSAEVGAHLHPWNTPPFDEPLSPENTMLKNLPRDLQVAKLRTLKTALADALGTEPISFRAGRFGFDGITAGALIQEGFTVDSSVTPFVNWEDHGNGPDFSDAPLDCYRLDGRGPADRPVEAGPLVEVPVSCAFTRRPFAWRGRLHRRLIGPRLRPFKLAGLLSRAGLLRRVIGSPETDDASDLLDLARCLIDEGVDFFHIFFHSPSLVPGLSPFVSTRRDLEQLYTRIEEVVTGIGRLASVEPVTVAELAAQR